VNNSGPSFFISFETGPPSVAQAGLKLVILLPLPLKSILKLLTPALWVHMEFVDNSGQS
jgi:hypothetical protein